MINLEDIKRAAHEATDEQGKPVIQIPRDLWDEWLAQQSPSELRSDNKRALALLAEWAEHPDDTPEEWWDEFQAFLKANRLDLS